MYFMKYALDFSFEELLLIRVSLKDRRQFAEYMLKKAKQDGYENGIIVYSAEIADINKLIDRFRPYTDLSSDTKQ